METLRALLSGCMASLSFSSPKGSTEALPEVFSPLQNLPAPSHTANSCRIKQLPTLTERLCEIAASHMRLVTASVDSVVLCASKQVFHARKTAHATYHQFWPVRRRFADA